MSGRTSANSRVSQSITSGLFTAAQDTALPYDPGRVRAHAHIKELIEREACVILDGGTATELREAADDRPELQERLWGTGALVRAPDDVLRVHRHYVDVGCDVISTDTWGLPTALRDERPQLWEADRPVHWMDVARRGVQLARRATAEAGRDGECAVAFSLNGDVDTPEGAETIRLLARVFEDDPPDIILLETLSLVRGTTYATVERLLATGIPVWLSFRRCRSGVCGVYGEHWGGPEGDAFGRAARRFEQMGVDALLVNCIPPDHVGGMLSWMRDFTDLPLGVYPNLGYLSTAGWRTEAGVGGAEYAQMALAWREEGAQIIGGCCGVGPEHVAAARAALEGTPPGHARPLELVGPEADEGVLPAGARVAPWTDARGLVALPARLPRHPVRAGRVRAHPGQLPGVEVPVRRAHRRAACAASTSAAAPACRPCSSPATAPRMCTRSTSTARGAEHAHERVSKRRRRPGDSGAPSTSTRGCRRSATT